MKIAFDGRCLADLPLTGVGRAFLNALAAYVPNTAVACTLLLPPAASPPPIPGLACVAAPQGALQRQRELPRLLRRLGVALLHSPVAAVPLLAPCPVVATVHDLPWLHPAAGEPGSWRRRLATRWSLQRAAAILAPSEFTAAAVRQFLGATAAQRLHVVPHGTTLGQAPTAAAIAARNGPLLAFGDARPRKNLHRLRQAHAQAAATSPHLPALQLLGPAGEYVDEARKLQLLQHCRAVIQVPRYEGFGMPVLEALAHGAPLLAADLPPLRELAGDNALYVPPDDTAAIAAGIVRIASDADLRQRLAMSGYQRACSYTPERTAAAWLQIHQQLLEQAAT